MYYVYVLKNSLGNLYIGYSEDLKRRVAEHAKRHKFKLIYYESYNDEKTARIRERNLKYYGSAWRGLKKRLNL